MRKIAIILSGCGFKDGTEITEAVSAFIALSEAGANYECFAPTLHFQAVNHLTQETTSEARNTLVEAARIARGQIRSLQELKSSEFDGLCFPGGFGAALRLSDWGTKGAEGKVLPEIEKIILKFHEESKPILAICIAPTLLAKTLGQFSATLTIGSDQETAREIEKTGAHHVECPVDNYVTDRENKLITTPAYMYDAKPSEVFKGIRAAVRELVEMA